MSLDSEKLRSALPEDEEISHLVSPEQYGLPKVSAEKKLTPLDMNMPRLYGTRWILCFPLPPSADKLKIYDELKAGLAYTISEVPWMSGDVGPEKGSDPAHNRIQVVSRKGGVYFKYKDFTQTPKGFPSYDSLKNARFPLAELSTALLSPLSVMPQASQPVMAAQANFIDGGLLLAVGAHHSACDGIGFNTILEIWAANTSAASASTSFITTDANSNNRTTLMTGAPGFLARSFPEYILAPTPPADTTDVNSHQLGVTPMHLPPMTAHIFYFSSSSLSSLKTTAVAYSTNDALLALLWHRITIARNPLGPSPATKTTALLSPINIRSRISPPLPPTYLGNASMASITKRLPISSVTCPTTGLRSSAAAIRTSLNAFRDTPDRIPLTLGLIASRQDPTDYKFAYNGFLGPDLSTTTWAEFPVYDADWGSSLGKIEAFRIPGEGFDGAIMVLPRVKAGGLEVVVGLETGAMGRLVADEEFGKYAELLD